VIGRTVLTFAWSAPFGSVHAGAGAGLHDGSGVGTASALVVKFTSSTCDMPATAPVAISWRISLAVIGHCWPFTSRQLGCGASVPASRAFRAAL
jgi:hypothetical protein